MRVSRCSSLRCHRLPDTRYPRRTWRPTESVQRSTTRCNAAASECCAYFLSRIAARRMAPTTLAKDCSAALRTAIASVGLPSDSGRMLIDRSRWPQALDGNTTNDDSKLSYDVSRCGTPCLHSSTAPRTPESAFSTGAPYREYCSALFPRVAEGRLPRRSVEQFRVQRTNGSRLTRA
jgi:hypothetical protein